MPISTADSLIQSLLESSPELYPVLFALNKDLQDTKAALGSLQNIIKMGISPQPPISNNSQGTIYFDRNTLRFMVSENGAPFDFLTQNTPACQLNANVSQALSAGVPARVVLHSGDVIFDPHSLIDVTNNRINLKPAGIWICGYTLYFATTALATNNFWGAMLINGNNANTIAYGETFVNDSGDHPGLNGSSIYKSFAGDYLELWTDSFTNETLNAYVFWAARIGGTG